MVLACLYSHGIVYPSKLYGGRGQSMVHIWMTSTMHPPDVQGTPKRTTTVTTYHRAVPQNGGLGFGENCYPIYRDSHNAAPQNKYTYPLKPVDNTGLVSSFYRSGPKYLSSPCNVGPLSTLPPPPQLKALAPPQLKTLAPPNLKL